MTELLAGLALVIAVASAFVSVILASEVGALKRAARSESHAPRVAPLSRVTLAGASVQVPPAEPSILLFALQQCSPCEQLLEAVRTAEEELRAAIVLITQATPESAASLAAMAGISPGRVVVDRNGEVARHFSVLRYPSALAATGGRVGRAQIVNVLADLRGIVADAARDRGTT